VQGKLLLCLQTVYLRILHKLREYRGVNLSGKEAITEFLQPIILGEERPGYILKVVRLLCLHNQGNPAHLTSLIPPNFSITSCPSSMYRSLMTCPPLQQRHERD
jgi:hypothetical protein